MEFYPEHPTYNQNPKFTPPKRDDEQPRPFHTEPHPTPLPRGKSPRLPVYVHQFFPQDFKKNSPNMAENNLGH